MYMYNANVFEIWIHLRVTRYHAMITCIPFLWQINDRSALQSVFSSMIWPSLVSSENLPLLHVNGESISLSVIYQQYQIHVRENRGDHYEWAIKRHWQPWLHKIEGRDKQSKYHNTNTYTTRRISTKPEWTQEPTKDRQFLLLIRHSACYSSSQAVLDTSISSSLYQ